MPAETVICALCAKKAARCCAELAYGSPDARGQRSPGLLADLDDVVHRQVSRRGEGRRMGHSGEEPLLFHIAASELKVIARNRLAYWRVTVSEPTDRLRELSAATRRIAAWLSRHEAALSMAPGAGEMVAELEGLHHRVQRMVDAPPDRMYAGPCLEMVEGVRCPEHLYAVPHKATVRCVGCGAEHSLAARRVWLLEVVHDELATPMEIARAMPVLLDRPLSVKTIYTWASTGALDTKPAHPHDPHRRPRFRIGDVVALAAARGARHRGQLARPAVMRLK
jgi:hypothetical protein